MKGIKILDWKFDESKGRYYTSQILFDDRDSGLFMIRGSLCGAEGVCIGEAYLNGSNEIPFYEYNFGNVSNISGRLHNTVYFSSRVDPENIKLELIKLPADFII